MSEELSAMTIAAEIRRVRQIRQYRPDPIPDDVLTELLEVARWTGSSRNTQPWHFVVLTDPERLRQISEVRDAINWVATAPLAIAIVLDGRNESSEAYDEGRVTERLLVAARFFGVGGGTAWFGNADQQAAAKRILGVPDGRTARSVVALGYPITAEDPRPNRAAGGRKPLAEIVSRERFGPG
ncbi:MAG: Nitroreductase [uncultured Thermomicrobiales bacterium]|uniref:Nitroreductase n=1 Tax=uncultured Thermomicrobiales bacterium TaxID=1645740 RepID=A0A6J4UY36_9BACT|nr:MAG: Nitroreductase [uncultured Thermomicrobiales bacterium]